MTGNLQDWDLSTVEDEALDWIVTLRGETVRDADLEALAFWRSQSPDHEAALARAARIRHALLLRIKPRFGLAPVDPSTQHKGIRPDAATLGFSRRTAIWTGAGIAAGVLGTATLRPPLGLWPSVRELRADYRTAKGERRQIDLSVGLSLELNTNTSVNLAFTGGDATAIELVEGETAVTVAPGGKRMISVRAGGCQVTASDATFTVRNTGAFVLAACLTGSADVRGAGVNRTLGAMQQLKYTARGIAEAGPPITAPSPTWREGYLNFKREPLVNVIEELNRYRPGRLVLIDARLGQVPITARFEIERLPDVALQIGDVFRVKVRSLPGGIVLIG